LLQDLPAARVAPDASLGALDRYTLGLVSTHAHAVTDAYEQLDFKGVSALSVSFNAVQLSAFLFDHGQGPPVRGPTPTATRAGMCRLSSCTRSSCSPRIHSTKKRTRFNATGSFFLQRTVLAHLVPSDCLNNSDATSFEFFLNWRSGCGMTSLNR
jgi:hypothetical protein